MPQLKPPCVVALIALIVFPLACASGSRPASKRQVDVTSAGAVGDGKTLDTAAIQKAIDQVSAAGGGIVELPGGAAPGRQYLVGTIQIKTGVTLRLGRGATLLGSTDVADYKNLDPFTDGSGNPMGHALVVAVDADRVGIEGAGGAEDAGVIDGQSPALKKKQGDKYTMRPFLVRWVRCTNVSIRDVRLQNPGAWTLNFYRCKDATVENVTIRSRDLGMHNNDGVNIDSSERVRVANCDVISGDDALVIKSTSRSQPSRDIVATNCKLSTRTNAIKLGTESIGGFSNIRVSNCTITNTKMAGIALYEVDGADLRDVRIENVSMDGVIVPISIRLGARLKTFRAGDQPRPEPGTLRDIVIRNVTAKNVEMIGMLINGVPGHPVEQLALENVALQLPGGGTPDLAKVELPEKEAAYPEYNTFGTKMPAYGIYLRHARGITFKDVRLTLEKPDARPAAVFVDAEDVTPKDFLTRVNAAK
jgi:polygalacturonase